MTKRVGNLGTGVIYQSERRSEKGLGLKKVEPNSRPGGGREEKKGKEKRGLKTER